MTFEAGIVRGLLVLVTPDGWRVRLRGALVACGPESGAAGVRAALDAIGRLPC